jgi:hypothetical protein
MLLGFEMPGFSQGVLSFHSRTQIPFEGVKF